MEALSHQLALKGYDVVGVEESVEGITQAQENFT